MTGRKISEKTYEEMREGSPHGEQGERNRLVTLFFTMLYISAFTFGGGFVIVTFMKRKFVEELRWMDEEEMLDYAALAQASPGAIAVNAAILVGWKIAGLSGMLIAVLGTVMPPLIILSVLSVFYTAFASNFYVALVLKGMQAGVAAVILSAAWDLGATMRKNKSGLSYGIFIAAFICDFLLDINVVYIILSAAFIGAVRVIMRGREQGR